MLTEKSKIESAYREKVARDTKADKELLDQCIKAHHALIEERHECKCCSPEYPCSSDYFLDDEGTLHARWDADHPNDIRDEEISITELLGVTI